MIRSSCVLVTLVSLVSLSLAGCDMSTSSMPRGLPACANYAAFELDLVPGSVGQPSPVKAAVWFAGHAGLSKIGVRNIPTGGWREVIHDSQGATVYSGRTILHVVQASDATWRVDSGKRCS